MDNHASRALVITTVFVYVFGFWMLFNSIIGISEACELSERKLFSNWLLEKRNRPVKFPTYEHEYGDGRIIKSDYILIHICLNLRNNSMILGISAEPETILRRMTHLRFLIPNNVGKSS